MRTGIVGRFKSAAGGVEFDFVAGLHFVLKLFFEGRGRELGPALKHVNAVRPDRGEQVVQGLRRMDVMGNQVISPRCKRDSPFPFRHQ